MMRALFLATTLGFAMPLSAFACSNMSLPPLSTINLQASALTTPVTYSVVAGGTASVTECFSAVNSGWLPDNADILFNLSGAENYRIVIAGSSSCDTLLLVAAGRGHWLFDDDSGGNHNPRVVVDRVSDLFGPIYVFYGTYQPVNCQGQITISAIPR